MKEWVNELVCFSVTGMGKGQHRMPSKDELVQRYNRMNTIPQTRSIQSRFLQSRNLNCIALCEVITSKDLQKHGNIWVCPVSDHVCTRFFFVHSLRRTPVPTKVFTWPLLVLLCSKP
nr:PREDICTED: poly [ADP-ribose] polymerase 6-like isoform X3 [Bos indicus]